MITNIIYIILISLYILIFLNLALFKNDKIEKERKYIF